MPVCKRAACHLRTNMFTAGWRRICLVAVEQAQRIGDNEKRDADIRRDRAPHRRHPEMPRDDSSLPLLIGTSRSTSRFSAK